MGAVPHQTKDHDRPADDDALRTALAGARAAGGAGR
jgi:hypothetical protein